MNIFVSPLLYITVYVPWSINKLFLFLCIFLAAEKRFPLCFFYSFFASLCVQYSPVCKRTYPCNIMACILLQGVLCKSNQVTKDPDVTKKPGILPSYLHYFNHPDNSILGWVIQGAAQTKIGYPNVKALKQFR